ncbi:MAG: carboxypeptidase-like regulatory domain-containing protein [Acidobacteria bacterium]|nr:carboxypeptidase-like regulatory domain-containing protein [Acidobacteriota bacterium]
MSRISTSLFCLLNTLIIALQAGPEVFAQTQTTGAVRGIVYESGTKAPIAGAVISVRNQENGLERSTITNADGIYFIAMLPVGYYLVSGSCEGYVKDPDSIVGNFPIHLSKTNVVEPPPIVLRRVGTTAPGQPTPAVAQPGIQNPDSPTEQLVNTLNGTRGGNFDRRQLTMLPLPGIRTFESLAFLLPGVAPPPQPLSGTVGPGIGAGIGTAGQFSVNGSRSRSNNFTIDGSDNNDEDIGVRRQGFVALIPQSIESLQEFQIFTQMWDAGNGRNTGSQANAITQSGTSLIHGTVYGFFNNDALNARNFFDYSSKGSSGFPLEARTFSRITGPGDCQGGARTSDGCIYTASLIDSATGVRTPISSPNPSEAKNPFSRFQGGFTIGGPLSKKYFGPLGHAGEPRTFFFTSLERQDVRAKQETHFSVPTIAERGFLGSGASGFRIPVPSPFKFGIGVAQNPNGNCQGPNPSHPSGVCFEDRAPIIRPTFTAGDSVFALFPFPNNPVGPYGGNTFTQVLSANAVGTVFSFKFDHNFKFFDANRPSTFTARYNFTNDELQVPAVGNAIYSSIEPRVGTQNLSLYVNTQFAVRTSNQVRGSFGRTRLEFDPMRDPSLLASQFAQADQQNSPFLLNNRRLLNLSCMDLADSPANLQNMCASLQGIPALPRNRFGVYSVDTRSTETIESNLGPIGQMTVVPFSPVGIDPFLFPQGRVNNTYQIADTASLFRGDHIIQIGGDVRRTQLNSFLDRNFRPQVSFGGTTDFSGEIPLSPDSKLPVEAQRLSRYGTTPGFFSGADLAAVGVPTGIFQSLSLGAPDTTIGLRLWQYNFFFNDSWRARHGLTLNFGLRYEYNTVPREVNDRIERTFDLSRILPPVDPAFDFNFGDMSLRDTANTRNNELYKAAIDATLAALSPFVSGRASIYESDRNNFGPRFSFAWDPLSGNSRQVGKTVIRGGAGIYYDVALGSVVSQSRNVFPTFIPFNIDVNTFNLAGPFIGSPRRNDSIANATQIRGRVGSSPSNAAAFVQAGCEQPTPDPQTGRLVYRCNLVQPGTLNVLGFPSGAQQLFLGRILNPTIARELTIGSGSGLAFTLPDRNLKSPEVFQFNLQLERELFNDFLVNVAYVGSRGVNLTRFRTPNGGLNSPTTPLDPLLLSFAQGGDRLRPAVARPPLSTATNLERPIADLGAFTIFDSSASSSYHALQSSVTKRFARGWQMTLAYTWSHAIDESSDVFDLAGAFNLPQDNRDLRAERGDASFDVRHRFVVSTLSDVPFLSRFNNVGGTERLLLGGWQITSITTLQTGQPFTVNSSFDVNLDGNLTDRLDTTNCLVVLDSRQQRLDLTVSPTALLAAAGQEGRVGRNTFRASGVVNVDLTLIKNFRLKNDQVLIFRAEFFNLFNRTQYGIPVRILEAPSFGRSVDTSLSPRQLQFALKYVF